MFLQKYNNKREKFLDHIVTGDKIWISYSNAEMKNKTWCGSTVVSQNKESQTFCGTKLMATIFGGRKGAFLVGFTNPGATVTSEVYCEMLNN
jgi:Transposase.